MCPSRGKIKRLMESGEVEQEKSEKPSFLDDVAFDLGLEESQDFDGWKKL